MDTAKLRAAVGTRPFRPVRITLHAGPPIVVRHPEAIAIREQWVAVFRDPDPPLIFEAEMVVSIEYLRNGRTRK